MEEMVNHIRELEVKNKKLEEENKKLKEENDMLKAEVEEKEKIAELEANILRLQSSEEGLEKKLDTGGWSPTSSAEPKQ